MEKDNIQNMLLEIGRKIVREKGKEALTARKLSEASGCSVGAIYNQFSNMENFIVIQNYMTLDALEKKLSLVQKSGNFLADIHEYLDVFVDFVINNKNLWYMLYDFHLSNDQRTYSYFYLRKVVKIVDTLNESFLKITPQMAVPERILTSQVLWLTLFSMSSLLTKDILDSFTKINRKTICKILLDTYIAGVSVLENKNE